MKICNVSVDVDNLPKKEVIIRMALNTKTYMDNPNALVEINSEIKKSGLYPQEASNPKTNDDGLHRVIATKSKKSKPRK